MHFFVYVTCCVCLEVRCARLYVIGKATLEDGMHTYVCVHPQMCSKFIVHKFMQYVECMHAYTIMTQLFVYGSTFWYVTQYSVSVCVLTQSRCSCLCMLACASAYECVRAQVCLRFIVYVCIEDKRRFVVHFHNFLGVNGSRNIHKCCHGSICCLCYGLICLCGYQLLRLSAQLTVSKPVVFQWLI